MVTLLCMLRSRPTRRVVRAVAFAAAISLATPLGGCAIPGRQVVDGPGLVGTYTVNGVDVVGSEYSGTVVIRATDTEDVYEIDWLVTGALLTGTGTLTGDRFVVRWRTIASDEDTSTGTGSYTVDDEGNIFGTRSVDGVDGVGTEEIFQEA